MLDNLKHFVKNRVGKKKTKKIGKPPVITELNFSGMFNICCKDFTVLSRKLMEAPPLRL